MTLSDWMRLIGDLLIFLKARQESVPQTFTSLVDDIRVFRPIFCIHRIVALIQRSDPICRLWSVPKARDIDTSYKIESKMLKEEKVVHWMVERSVGYVHTRYFELTEVSSQEKIVLLITSIVFKEVRQCFQNMVGMDQFHAISCGCALGRLIISLGGKRRYESFFFSENLSPPLLVPLRWRHKLFAVCFVLAGPVVCDQWKTAPSS